MNFIKMFTYVPILTSIRTGSFTFLHTELISNVLATRISEFGLPEHYLLGVSIPRMSSSVKLSE